MVLNLHAIANRCIQCLSPNVQLVLIRNTSLVNEYGEIKATYGDCELISAQKQTLNGDEQALVNEQLQNEFSRKFYFSNVGQPVVSGRRDLQEAPTYFYEVDSGTYWRIYNINEDYQSSSWLMVFATLQNNVPPEVESALKESGLVKVEDHESAPENE